MDRNTLAIGCMWLVALLILVVAAVTLRYLNVTHPDACPTVKYVEVGQ